MNKIERSRAISETAHKLTDSNDRERRIEHKLIDLQEEEEKLRERLTKIQREKRDEMIYLRTHKERTRQLRVKLQDLRAFEKADGKSVEDIIIEETKKQEAIGRAFGTLLNMAHPFNTFDDVISAYGDNKISNRQFVDLRIFFDAHPDFHGSKLPNLIRKAREEAK